MTSRPLLPLAFLLASVLGEASSPQADAPDDPPTLAVSGRAEVAAKPDRAILSLGTVAQAQTAALAQEQVERTMQSAIAGIVQAGIAEERIQTSGLSLYPVYSERPRSLPQGESDTPRIVAYRATNSVRVEIHDLAAIGGVIDAGVGAGANQLEGLHFDLRDDTEKRADALQQATRNARLKAEALAEAADVELLSIQSLVEGPGIQPLGQGYGGAARMAVMEAGTPIQPGEVRIEAIVQITYRVGPKAGDGPKED